MPNNDHAPSLDDLRVFLAVADANGFRTAAKRLGQSPSTVSETITRLEVRLGVPLFSRTTRSIMLTEAGRALATRTAPLLSEARAALDEASSSQSTVRGRLRLNVPGAVMFDILPPIIDRYMAAHPQVRVELVVEDRLVDITAADCDAGIRYGEHLQQDMIAIPIGPRRQQAALAAAPAYLERRGTPEHPSDLLQHDCIRIRISGAAVGAWEFEHGEETLLVDPPSRLIVNTAGAMASIDLARRGQGLVYTFRNWLHPHFADNTLVPVLEDWWQRYDGPRLYFSRRFMPAPLRAFVDQVAQER
ncbi:LysR family transcriptional regulator [Tianweitania sp. BSSL-BM11]|uniref:LysR family transcriptional regulator n=1 Tax=Tianweitania aestuarii TaxID=2814886 RepID=A0ABS5S0H4_9HYPH|nr:LysR family transcriptional regulator [Tianweitania aestuarii]MBS9721964.1 LysR family transcriptional regulator [Tianweitania aestuarii]